MTNRRGFLGSTLGIFIGSQIPWIAREPTIPKIPGYRTAIRLVDDTLIQGPRIQEIIDGTLIFAPIDVTQQITVKEFILYYDDLLIGKQRYTFPVPATLGDVLKFTLEIN